MTTTNVRVLIELLIAVDGTEPHIGARHVIDTLLDNGVFQDAIQAHECEADPMRVTASSVLVVDGGSGATS